MVSASYPEDFVFSVFKEALKEIIDDVFLDTTDLRFIGILSEIDKDEEHFIGRGITAQIKALLDGAVYTVGTFDSPPDTTYNVQIIIGETIYIIDTDFGYFSRERDGEIQFSQQREWIGMIRAWLNLWLD